MLKLLIGGSPCTHWSIAQTKNRETEPSGIGWELFENYLIALEKFKPDCLDEACRNGEDALTIRYWVGYLDALRAVEKGKDEV